MVLVGLASQGWWDDKFPPSVQGVHATESKDWPSSQQTLVFLTEWSLVHCVKDIFSFAITTAQQ